MSSGVGRQIRDEWVNGNLTSEEKDEFSRLPGARKEFWVIEGLRIRDTRIMIDWITRGVPELTDYANDWKKDIAIVLGSGPSIQAVKSIQWEQMGHYFTVGVNTVPRWLQRERKIHFLPHLCMVMDLIRDKKDRESFEESYRNCQNAKILAGSSADDVKSADWVAHSHLGNPVWDIRYGIWLTPGITMARKWGRTVVGAIILCAQLGFKRICLLGADHGNDYRKNEVENADWGYARLSKWLKEKDIELINCGSQSSVSAIPYIPLQEVLDGRQSYI